MRNNKKIICRTSITVRKRKHRGDYRNYYGLVEVESADLKEHIGEKVMVIIICDEKGDAEKGSD